MNTTEKANLVVERRLAGETIESIRSDLFATPADWHRISIKAYAVCLKKARKQRKIDLKKRNYSASSPEEIDHLLDLNEKLGRFALCIPPLATQNDVNKAEALLGGMPQNEAALLDLIESITLDPSIRALQNIGRISQFSSFRNFQHIVEAATLCYYRGNYISSYLTLVPVIEGIILRWSGYDGSGTKPEFEEIRKFFKTSHLRQPCPGNPLFHHIFTKACSDIINDHLYKPTTTGAAHSEFSRHQAAHLLQDSRFATRENCIRLFLLIDLMTEIYLYESGCKDPRWTLRPESYNPAAAVYQRLVFEGLAVRAPELQLDPNPIVQSVPGELP